MGKPMDQCLTNRFLIIDDFLSKESALSLRADIDAHFADSDRHGPDQQIWNYWYVPDSYTYLRTSPEKIIAKAKIDGFMKALGRWSAVNLGFAKATWPNLSLYIPGCSQVLHNDSTNGRMGYVYSLTRNERKTIGGETIVMEDKDLFRAYLDRPAAGLGLFDRIEPRFNRLVLFDDRVPHAVQRVEGSMDPVRGTLRAARAFERGRRGRAGRPSCQSGQAGHRRGAARRSEKGAAVGQGTACHPADDLAAWQRRWHPANSRPAGKHGRPTCRAAARCGNRHSVGGAFSRSEGGNDRQCAFDLLTIRLGF